MSDFLGREKEGPVAKEAFSGAVNAVVEGTALALMRPAFNLKNGSERLNELRDLKTQMNEQGVPVSARLNEMHLENRNNLLDYVRAVVGPDGTFDSSVKAPPNTALRFDLKDNIETLGENAVQKTPFDMHALDDALKHNKLEVPTPLFSSGDLSFVEPYNTSVMKYSSQAESMNRDFRTFSEERSDAAIRIVGTVAGSAIGDKVLDNTILGGRTVSTITSMVDYGSTIAAGLMSKKYGVPAVIGLQLAAHAAEKLLVEKPLDQK